MPSTTTTQRKGPKVLILGPKHYLTDEIFSWTCPSVEREYSWNASAIRRDIEAGMLVPERFIAEMHPQMLNMLAHRGIEQSRLDRMAAPYMFQPVLALLMPDEITLIIDGHHRLLKLHLNGFDSFMCHRLPFATAQPYEFVLCPSPA